MKQDGMPELENAETRGTGGLVDLHLAALGSRLALLKSRSGLTLGSFDPQAARQLCSASHAPRVASRSRWSIWH